MPDEKVLSSCLLCKWAEPIVGPQSPAWLEREPRIKCGLHSFVVWKPRLHFCSQFSNGYDKAVSLVDYEQLDPDQMYAWVEIQYQIMAASEIMHVHHELMQIAPQAKFANLTTIEKSSKYQKLHHKIWMRFQQEYGEKIEEEGMYQKMKPMRDRRKLRDKE